MPAYANATELYTAMLAEIQREQYVRTVTDPESPAATEMLEARPGCSFELRFPAHNVVACREVDIRWAVANTLHFFAATEEAEPLFQYNRYAPKFLTGTKWVGAYGAIAVPQIRTCIKRLLEHPATRRAIVSMGGPENQDRNRPACWSFLQFLRFRNKLHMTIYQRSLNLCAVMPYDCVVLTNVLHFVCAEVGAEPGSLHWTVGSLHAKRVDMDKPPVHGQRNLSLLLPATLARDPAACYAALQDDLRGVL